MLWKWPSQLVLTYLSIRAVPGPGIVALRLRLLVDFTHALYWYLNFQFYRTKEVSL